MQMRSEIRPGQVHSEFSMLQNLCRACLEEEEAREEKSLFSLFADRKSSPNSDIMWALPKIWLNKSPIMLKETKARVSQGSHSPPYLQCPISCEPFLTHIFSSRCLSWANHTVPGLQRNSAPLAAPISKEFTAQLASTKHNIKAICINKIITTPFLPCIDSAFISHLWLLVNVLYLLKKISKCHENLQGFLWNKSQLSILTKPKLWV